MNHDITYRPITPADFDGVKRLLDKAFGFARFVRKDHVRASVLELYLRDCLVASSFSQVAVRDGAVVGVILTRAKDEPYLAGRLRHRLISWAHKVKVTVSGGSDLPAIREWLKIDGAYGPLRKQVDGGLLHDEITLLAVSEEARGQGVGRRLFDVAEQHLRSRGRGEFHLFTDTTCTYQFYDKRGLTRAATHPITVDAHGVRDEIDVFIYTGKVPVPA